MSRKNVATTANALTSDDLNGRRRFVMEMLNQAHLDFAAMGKLAEAGPLLHELIAIAHSQTQSTSGE